MDTSECVKKLHKHKPEAHFFDIELDFNSGKHSVYLRLSRGDKGVLEVVFFPLKCHSFFYNPDPLHGFTKYLYCNRLSCLEI